MRLVAEIDHLDLTVAAEDPDALLRVRPLVDDEVIGERLDGGDPLTGDVGEQLGPLAGRVDAARS